MSGLLEDARYGFRMLAKNPAFTAVAVLTLALGIGANVTVVSFVDAFFFRPLPVPDSSRFVEVFSARPGEEPDGSFSYTEYAYLRDHAKAYDALVADYPAAPLHLVDQAGSAEINGAVVSSNFFSVMGAKPALGRFFRLDEDAVPDRDPVAVLAYDLWHTRYQGKAESVGRTIRINSVAFSVIGVAPKDFHGALAGVDDEIYIPTMMLHVGYRWCDAFSANCTPLAVIGRLTPGILPSSAQAEITTLARPLNSSITGSDPRRGLQVRPVRGVDPRAQREYRSQMQLLYAVATIFLVIACANVAGLLLVRGSARVKEIAVRLAMGASRWRVIRQLLTESVLLAAIGGGLGAIFSAWAKPFLEGYYSANSEGFVNFYDVSLDRGVLAYSIVVTLLTGLLFGVAPAIFAARQEFVAALKQGGGAGDRQGRRSRQVLVAAQVALSFVLLTSAGLLWRSASSVLNGANFDPQHVLLLRVRPRLVSYPPVRARAYLRAVVTRLKETPGVSAVAFARGLGALWGQSGELEVHLPGQTPSRTTLDFVVPHQEISPDFFATLKLPLLSGRGFTEHDDASSPRVAVVNWTLAQHLWRGGSPLDHELVIEGQPYRVVGDCEDAQFRSAVEPPQTFVYLAFWQNPLEPQVDARMAIRVAGDPRAMLPQVRRVITAADANVPIQEDMPMLEQIEAEYIKIFLARTVVTWSGLLALLLSALGLYATVAFTVSRRTNEIGIRMAMGAQRRDVIRLFLRQGLGMTLAGVALGGVLTFSTARLLANFLYGVRPLDAWAVLAGALLLLTAALIANFVPARRAAGMDAMVALRYE